VIPLDYSLEGYFFGGLISYQDKDITILEVNKKEQNKNSKDFLVSDAFVDGFEFFQDGVIIAALQSNPMLKPNLWLRKDLDNKTQLIIASSIPVLLSKHLPSNINYINEED
jgi:hypothetical protein